MTNARDTNGRGRGGRGGRGRGGRGRGGRGSAAAANARALVPFVQGVLTVHQRNSELDDIMKGVVANSSMNQYTARNVNFILWLYEHKSYRYLIKPSIFDAMNIAKEGYEDKRLNKVQYGMALRGMIKLSLEQMDRKDPLTCPIKLQNLNFTIYSEYLLSLRRVRRKRKRKKRRCDTAPVPNLRIEGASNTGASASQSNGEDDENGGGGAETDGSETNSAGEEEERYLSKSTYGSARSALVHLYRSCGGVMPDDFRADMANFMRGIKRKVATQKEARGVRAEEGKAVMSFDCYHKLCELFLENENDESMFGHLF